MREKSMTQSTWYAGSGTGTVDPESDGSTAELAVCAEHVVERRRNVAVRFDETPR